MQAGFVGLFVETRSGRVDKLASNPHSCWQHLPSAMIVGTHNLTGLHTSRLKSEDEKAAGDVKIYVNCFA